MKNYFIVGASSGIGNALASKLAFEGNNVYGTYFSNDENIHSTPIQFSELDVTQEIPDLDFLPESLDGFVYCPGSINLLPFKRLKKEKLLADLQLHLLGAVEILQKVLPRLKNADDSSVLFFSTVAVQTGFNFHTQVSMVKGAIEGLTKSLAAELAPSIRVNAIAPSLTDTGLASKLLSTEEKKAANAERHPLKKIGNPNNIADLAEFLVSKKSDWITGQIITIDGGISTLKT